MRSPVNNINFDFNSGVIAKDSGDPNKCYLQQISDKKVDSSEILIFMDDSRSCSDDGNCDVECAVVVPCLKMKFMYRLNDFSNSYTVEAIAILKTMDLALAEKWTSINVCSDSLSLLMKLKTGLSSIFLFVNSNLNPTLMELLLKISKMIYSGIKVRFT